MQASECVVCHKTLDPVAGCSRTTASSRASTARARAAGSRTCSRPASRARTCRPTERWRALQWLGERTAKDPRFAVAMVEHVYYILTGRKVLLAAEGPRRPALRRQAPGVPGAAPRRSRRSPRASRSRLQPQERVQGLDRLRLLPGRRPGDRGRPTRSGGRSWTTSASCRMLVAGAGRAEGRTPSSASRGAGCSDQLAMLYGGIDSKEVTERATDPSGAMGAIQRILSNDVACKHIAARLRPQARRAPAVPRHRAGRRCPAPPPRPTPQIRQAIVHLHELVLGPLRRRRFRPRSSGRSSCSPASSPTPRSRRGSRSARAYSCRARRPRRPRRPALHDPRLARRASRTCCGGPSSCTSEPSCSAIDATSSSSAAWPASAWPSRSASRCSARAAKRRTSPTTGRTTSSSTPPAAGTRPT